MRNRILSLALALAMVLSLALVASPAVAADEPVTLNLTYPGGQEEFAMFQTTIDAHRDQLKGIDVNVIHIPAGEYWNKVTTMFAGGSAPDVTFMSEPFPQFASKGQLLPIEDKLTAMGAFNRSDWYEVGLKYFTYDGVLYGLPKDLNVYYTYFNEDLFKEAGLETPAELAKQGKWDRTAFRDAAIALTKRDGDSVTQYGCSFPGFGGWYFSAWMFSDGAEYLNDARTECLLNQPKAVETFQYWMDLALKDKVCPMPNTPSSALTGISFQTGKIAMEIAGSWNVPANNADEFKWNVAPMPVGEGIDQNQSYVHVAGWSVASATAHPDQALTLLAVLVSKEFQENLAGTGVGSIPPTISVSQSDIYLKSKVPSNHFIVFDMLKASKVYPFTVHDGDIDMVYKDYMEQMYEEGADIQALADEMVGQVNAILQG